MEKDLILEIGTEEIPAGFLEGAVDSLAKISERELKDNLLSYKSIETYATPRRLAVRVLGLTDKQSDNIVEVTGPPKRVAFDEGGKPTKAAIGFAKAQGVSVKELVISTSEKGEFVTVRKEIKGEKSQKILKNLLPKIILSLPFKKSMRWGECKTTFARPIRWILAIFGSKRVAFNLESIKSDSKTWGHRFISPKSFRVKNWEEYIEGLQERYVILDQNKRRKIIKDRVEKLAIELGGIAVDDNELLEITSQLVEYPSVLVGNFDTEFLELPEEVLISVMRHHQKYFPVFSKSNNDENLLPHFIFVSGTPVKDPKVVIKGNERVIKARFKDARFFFDEDTRHPLSDRPEKLNSMIFLSDLGTYYDKTQRLADLAETIGKKLGFQDSIQDIKHAAKLSKADLTTDMVFEFPELQGIMGKYYALISNEKEEVAKAIEEQYMPSTREGRLPETYIGSILSIADKVDNITACFLSGRTPTGTKDPYALRRQAIGIVNIMLSKEFHLDLNEIFNYSLKSFRDAHMKSLSPAKPETTLNEILEFMTERFKNLMLSYEFPIGVVEAVLATEFDDVVQTKKKIEALTDYYRAPDFNPLAIAFKRVVNIVKNQPRESFSHESLLENAETQLFHEYRDVKQGVEENVLREDYTGALQLMKKLKEPIDIYFDEVLVMDEDELIRNNRLSMLWEIRDLFFKVADFSKIST